MDGAERTHQPIRVVFAGGGTGGHVMPGLALAGALGTVAPHAQCLFLHTSRDTAGGYRRAWERFPTVCLPDLRWEGIAGKLRSSARLLPVLNRTLRAFARFSPSAVVGLGGSNCVIPVLAARMLNLPVLLLESNAVPGAAVSLLARRMDSVQLQWQVAARRLDTPVCRVNGIPVRDRIFRGDRSRGHSRFGLEEDRCTLLVMGGSQGARSLNRTVWAALKSSPLRLRKLQVIHLTGECHLEEARRFSAPGELIYRAVGYLEEIEDAYAVADIVLCRAGGSTLAELTALGRPAVLVPYPHAADNHQQANAQVLADCGAARCIEESDLTPGRLGSLLGTMLENPGSLRRMAERARSLGHPAAARTVALELVRLARGGRREDMSAMGEGYSHMRKASAA